MRSFTATTLLLALFSTTATLAAPLGPPMDLKAVEEVATSNLEPLEEGLSHLGFTNARAPPQSTFHEASGRFRQHAPPDLHIPGGRPVYDAAAPNWHQHSPATLSTPHAESGGPFAFGYKGSEYEAVLPSVSARMRPESPSNARFRKIALTALKKDKEMFKHKGSSPLADMVRKQRGSSFVNVVEMAVERNKQLQRQKKLSPEEWEEVTSSPTRDSTVPSEDTSRFNDSPQNRWNF
ncbi:uncharacterized protein UTRI_06547 [Ustilago trichophora]|uniref:Uncharacterized protein n=1 Tax=Ustilago trichophora TaxID=86804 RepID=A0A5C3ENU3_9BASI|nr:uncharacterized protein UTRI_06547 [Ustilago trichophora]